MDSEAWFSLQLEFTDPDMLGWGSTAHTEEEADEEYFEEVVVRTVVRRKDQLCINRRVGVGP